MTTSRTSRRRRPPPLTGWSGAVYSIAACWYANLLIERLARGQMTWTYAGYFAEAFVALVIFGVWLGRRQARAGRDAPSA